MITILLIPVALFFSGCFSLTSSKGEKHQLELNVHKVRTELEDIKHELNTYEMEHHVIEGKLTDQEQTITALKTQLAELKSGKLESFMQDVQNLEGKIDQMSKKQDGILSDVKHLNIHANDTSTALLQYKDRLSSFEKALESQSKNFKDLIKLKEEVSSLYQVENLKAYKVRPGDTLEKIAKENGKTIEDIKKVNNISSNLIVTGQIIYIP